MAALADVTDSEKRRRTTDAIEEIVANASARVSRFQDVVRGKPATFESIELRPFVDEVLATMRRGLERRRAVGEGPRAKLVAEVGTLGSLRCDPAALQRALSGVLSHAFDAARGQRPVTFKAVRQKGIVTFDISDDGAHFTDAQLRALFDPFAKQPSHGRTTQGLWQARQVLEQLGGELSVSQGTRQRVTVRMRIPVKRVEAAPSRPKAAGATGKVLFVEDDAFLRESVAALFPKERRLTAATGAQALTLVRGAPDVQAVVTDLGLPDTDGWTLARKLRKLRPSLRIVVMSAWARDIRVDDRRRALVDAVLQKPPTVRELFDSLSNG